MVKNELRPDPKRGVQAHSVDLKSRRCEKVSKCMNDKMRVYGDKKIVDKQAKWRAKSKKGRE